jgi:hypothetical protein
VKERGDTPLLATDFGSPDFYLLDRIPTIARSGEDAFDRDIDYAMLQKIYGTEQQGEHRYLPRKVWEHARRSLAERQTIATFQPATRNGKT